jgi:hypothetical protein
MSDAVAMTRARRDPQSHPNPHSFSNLRSDA